MTNKTSLIEVAMTADQPNANGVVYPGHVLRKAIEEAQARIDTGIMLGTLDPSSDRVRVADASHEVTHIRMRGPDVIARIKCLDTPNGKILQDLITRSKVRLMPVGRGKIEGGLISEYSLSTINVELDIDPATGE